ncbi:MAG: EAL domain-containing protein [Gammaproteobacteria bacterium]|nr:EAL domain-containing protein [Gammaproteobacteria bacterium]
MANSNADPEFQPSFDLDDDKVIEKKVKFELDKSHCKVIKLGALANVTGGIFIIWILYNQTVLSHLICWYVALVFINVINTLWALYYERRDVTLAELKHWRMGLYAILVVLCLIWGSIGFVFVSTNPHYQLFIITFLQVVVLGFCFGSVVDFNASAICITLLLSPTIIFRLSLVIRAILDKQPDSDLNLAFALNLFILGAFLMAVAFIGHRLLKNFFKVSLTNVELSKRLEHMNKSLEKRVAERTAELQSSLDLVTYQATHDLLTDLPNQRLLIEYLEAAVRSADAGAHYFAVIFFTINEVEKINDGLGYQAGDLVIQTVAKRFKKLFQNHAISVGHGIQYTITLSRKDVFVILLDPILSVEEIEKANAIFSILDQPVLTPMQAVKLTASVGISLYPRDGRDIKTLLMHADSAMSHAKQLGGNNFMIYQAENNVDLSKQLEIERNLHNAVENNEFIVLYQPVVDLKTGKICSGEALVRWNSPTLGLISPDKFIPLAEANGIIIPLGAWVLLTACRQAKEWHDKGYNTFKMAINLSAKQLQKKSIIETMEDVIRETKLEPQFIELELTESEAFKLEVMPILNQFESMGFRLSIDDFGTGYSGLSSLKLASFETLKIDRSFIKDIETNSNNKAIVSNTITLAKKMNLKVIAEGVETKEQLQFLKEHDCDMIQGYYFSPPVTAEAFTKLLVSDKRYAT